MNKKIDNWERRLNAWKEEKKSDFPIHHHVSEPESSKIKEQEEIRDIPLKIEQIKEKPKETHNHPVIKRILFLIAYLIPISVLLYLGYYIFHPALTGSDYSYILDIGVKGDDSTNKPLYLEKSKSLSPHVLYGSETYREIIKTIPFDLTFKSPVIIPEKSKVMLSLDFLGTNSSLYINNSLIMPNLENYELLKETENSYIFKKNALTRNYFIDSNNAEKFLIDNYYGSSVYSNTQLNTSIHISDYSPIETIINNTFRTNLVLIIYIEGDLNLYLEKQDLNWYAGEDNYTIYIKDLNENIIYSGVLPDDTDSSQNRIPGFEQPFYTKAPDLNGVYYLELKQGSKSSDSTIKNIKLNTNKVLLYRNFLPLDPITFYTKNYFNKKIRFYYWHADAEQDIIVNNQTTHLGKEYDGVEYYHPLLSNREYEISIEKGDISISNDFTVSPKKENWFDIPLLIQKEFDNPDFIILDKSKVSITKEGFIIYKELSNNQEQNISIKADAKNQLKLKQAEIQIL